MSFLVQGAEIPRCCAECLFNHDAECIISNRLVCDDPYNKRGSWCQLVDIGAHAEEPHGTYECFHCLSRSVIWDSDFSFSDMGYDGNGIVHCCHCDNCGAEIEYWISCDDDITMCNYNKENGKEPCCTHDCDGCSWHEKTKTSKKQSISECIYEAIPYMFIHGAEWYLCPHCGFRFEIAQADREECNIKKTKEKGVYICPECNNKFRIV